MSYILEALKKSQAERELGRVPTLHTTNLLPEPAPAPVSNHWPLVAVGLASLSLIVALYSALRTPQGITPPDPGRQNAGPYLSETGGTVAETMSPSPPTTKASSPTTAALAFSEPSPIAQPPASAPSDSTTIPESKQTTESATSVAPHHDLTPLVEPPPPKASGAISPREMRPRGMDLAGLPAQPNRSNSATTEEARLQAELERQLETEAAMDATNEGARESVDRDIPTPVPADLVAAIDAFKQKVKGNPKRNDEKVRIEQHTEATTADKGTRKVNPSPVTAPSRSPGHSAKPTESSANPPTLTMNVHIFNPDPRKRFVLLNGLRYGEGEQTRSGLVVQEIQSNGVVLNQNGRTFFLTR